MYEGWLEFHQCDAWSTNKSSYWVPVLKWRLALLVAELLAASRCQRMTAVMLLPAQSCIKNSGTVTAMSSTHLATRADVASCIAYDRSLSWWQPCAVHVRCIAALITNAVVLLHNSDSWMLRYAGLSQHFVHSLWALCLQYHDFVHT